ncbi:MAG: hypothetical protein NT070_02100 [Cyanobacteria bacterium]|nr:hypothetical protein [Cyanobacteriota bacterium]
MIIARLWTLSTAAFLAFIPLSVNAAVTSPSQSLVIALDSALNAKNLGAISELLTPDYTHDDGYTRETLPQALQRLWKQYPNLTYKTEIISSDMNGETETIETLTTINGRRSNPSGQLWKITGTIRSQQVVQANRIRSQSILSEQTRITIGEKPPTVMVNLPDTVTVGKAYKYEAVIQEPINDDLFMGTVFDNPVSPTLLNQKQLQLQLPSIAELLSGRTRRTPAVTNSNQTVRLSRLASGGFFKIGTASKVPETRWISAVLARHEGGITIATHRLRTVR